MRIEMMVQDTVTKKTWTEEAEVPNATDPTTGAQALIDNFNKTLQPSERPRALVSVRVLTEYTQKEHDWEKTNLVTLHTRKHGLHDTLVCRRCGTTAIRRGLETIIIIKGKQRCDEAKPLEAPSLVPVLTKTIPTLLKAIPALVKAKPSKKLKPVGATMPWWGASGYEEPVTKSAVLPAPVPPTFPTLSLPLEAPKKLGKLDRLPDGRYKCPLCDYAASHWGPVVNHLRFGHKEATPQ